MHLAGKVHHHRHCTDLNLHVVCRLTRTMIVFIYTLQRRWTPASPWMSSLYSTQNAHLTPWTFQPNLFEFSLLPLVVILLALSSTHFLRHIQIVHSTTRKYKIWIGDLSLCDACPPCRSFCIVVVAHKLIPHASGRMKSREFEFGEKEGSFAFQPSPPHPLNACTSQCRNFIFDFGAGRRWCRNA